jgi:cell fate regulator YaaT (PSP1 superfamily)
VVLEAQGGHHLGFVSMQGELVRLQILKKKVQADSAEIKGIYRIATQKDLDKFAESRNKELPTLFRTRQLLEEFKLNMKMSDVEFQADCSKATFYYSADDRIDFRDLIKSLAGEFKVRVEMRQISLRQEAGRIGGIGSCGRELCCSTWLTDFKNVTTGAARYQNLSLNPAKLSGQCGRLKCCLNFELETYLDALKGIPNIDQPLHTEKGDAYLQKTDIFRRIMWFGYKGESTWHPLPIDRVNQVLALNKAGEKAKALTEKEEVEIEQALNPQPINDDLKRMDRKMLDRDRALKKKKQDLKQKQQPSKGTTSGAFPDAASSETSQKPRPNNNQNRPERRPENRTPRQSETENKPAQQANVRTNERSNVVPRQSVTPPPSADTSNANDLLAARKNALRERVKPDAAQSTPANPETKTSHFSQNQDRNNNSNRNKFKNRNKPGGNSPTPNQGAAE